jgi:uncharacterized OB-fold protein
MGLIVISKGFYPRKRAVFIREIMQLSKDSSRCKSCGAKITVKDRKCPKCGREVLQQSTHSHYSGVAQQQGRVVQDDDWDEDIRLPMKLHKATSVRCDSCGAMNTSSDARCKNCGADL